MPWNENLRGPALEIAASNDRHGRTVAWLSLSFLVICATVSCGQRASQESIQTAFASPVVGLTQDQVQSERDRASAFLADRNFSSLRKQIAAVAAQTTVHSDLHASGDRLLYEIQYPNKPYPVLAFRNGVDGSDHIFYQPTIGGVPAATEKIGPSPSGRLVATTMYLDDLHTATQIVDTATGAVYPETLLDLGPIVWLDDRTILYVRDNSFFRHVLRANPSTDRVLFSSPFVQLSAIDASSNRHHVLILGRAQGGSTFVYLFNTVDRLTRVICGPQDEVEEARFIQNTPVVRSRKRSALYDLYDASSYGGCTAGKALFNRVPLPLIDFFSDGANIIAEFAKRGNAVLYAFRMHGASGNRLHFGEEPVSVNQIEPFHDGALISLNTWYVEPVWYRVDSAGRLSRIGNSSVEARWRAILEVNEVDVPSLDGAVKIPMTILQRRASRPSSQTKTVLYGYGAFGTISGPEFEGTMLTWVLNGGVLVQARIRGGGELGDAWHSAATGFNKIRSAQDYVACARWLATHGYGDRRHTGLYSLSTGAYIAALALTQYPRTFAAAFLKSGLYDQTRAASPELGNAMNPRDFDWINRRSPLQRLNHVPALPALFLIHGSLDELHPVMQSRAFVAEVLRTHPDARGKMFYIEMPGKGHGRTDTYRDRIERSFWLQAFFQRFL